MLKIEKYTGKKTYMFPNGHLATPDRVLSDFPAILTFPHIIETDESGQVMFSVENLSAVKSRLGIDPALNDNEAIAEIELLRNAPPPVPEPSAEERIAAAMEYQNLMTMEDEAV